MKTSTTLKIQLPVLACFMALLASCKEPLNSAGFAQNALANDREPNSSTLTKRADVAQLDATAADMSALALSPVPAKTCSATQLAKILEGRTASQNSVNVKCSATLNSSDVVTKQLIFEGADASNIVFDCKGATLDKRGANAELYQVVVRSKILNDKSWSVPQNILVKNCKIIGDVRVYGMGTTGQAEKVRKSSHSLGHTERAQAAAPRHIVLDHMTFQADHNRAIYFAPGVTHSVLSNSRILGKMDSGAVYLDAESADNLIQNNTFDAEAGREIISIDGSSNNSIVGNFFSGLNKGGIYLYRNCGEGGTVRHQSPHFNSITNNVFYYNQTENDASFFEKVGVSIFNFFSPVDVEAGPPPAVWIASRNGNRLYCDDDKGFGFGSSADNDDLVKNTVVTNNQIYKLDPAKMIRISDAPVIIFGNTTIDPTEKPSTPESPSGRRSGCFAKNAFPTPYLADGQSTSLFAMNDPLKAPECSGTRLTCDDGALVPSSHSCEAPMAITKQLVNFECSSRAGATCAPPVVCPGALKVESVRAVCNLESNNLSTDALGTAPWNTLKIQVGAANSRENICAIGSRQSSLRSLNLNTVVGERSFDIACQHDQGQSGCVIRGQAMCSEVVPELPKVFRRIAMGRLYQHDKFTLNGGVRTQEKIDSIIASLKSLNPTFVTGLLRFDADELPTPQQIADYNYIRKTLKKSNPDIKFDLVLNSLHYVNAKDVQTRMGDLNTLFDVNGAGAPDIWFFDFFQTAYAGAHNSGDCAPTLDNKCPRPEAVLGAIAFAHANRQFVGGNTFGSKIPPGADFASVPDDNNLKLHLEAIQVLRDSGVEVIVHINNNPQTPADPSPQFTAPIDYPSYITDRAHPPVSCQFMFGTFGERKDYLSKNAAGQVDGDYHYMFPVYFPQCPVGSAYDSTLDHKDGDVAKPSMLDVMRDLMKGQ